MPHSRLQSHDIEIEYEGQRIGLYYARARGIATIDSEAIGASVKGRQTRGPLDPVQFDDFSGGMAGSRQLIDGTYSHMVGGYARKPRLWCPGGLVSPVTIPAGVGEILAFWQDGVDLYCGAGDTILRIPTSTGTPVVHGTISGAPEVITDGMVYPTAGTMLLGTRNTATDTPGRLWRYSGGTWNVGTPSVAAKAKYLAKAYFTVDDLGRYRIIRTDTNNSFKFTDSTDINGIMEEGIGGAWQVNAYPIGDAVFPITGIVEVPRAVWFTKTDGIWHVGEDGRGAHLTPSWRQNPSPYNGEAAMYWGDSLYCSYIQTGLAKVDVADLETQYVPEPAGVGQGMPNESPVFGRHTAMTTEAGWIVTSVFNGVDSWIAYGKPRSGKYGVGIEGPGAMLWHGGEAVLRNRRVTALHTTTLGSTGQPRIFIASRDLTNTTTYLDTLSCALYGDPITDWVNGGPWRPALTAAMYLPVQDWRAGTSRKTLMRFEVNTEHIEGFLNAIEVWAHADKGIAALKDLATDPLTTLWQRQGTAAASPYATMVASGAPSEGRGIGVLVKGVTDGIKPFALHSLLAQAALSTTQAEVLKRPIILAKTDVNRYGGYAGADTEELWTRLWDLQGRVVTVIERGQRTVCFFEAGLRKQEVEDAGSTITFTNLSLTVLRRPFLYGKARYGGDSSWG